jgi:predicted 3-demethylubiquinone-9 3-methyltransferase (glyoxalase superfamily)
LEPNLFSFINKYKRAKAAQRDLTARFKARGQKFMLLDATVHEAMVKEAMALGVETTMQHFDRIELISLGNGPLIVEHYRERSQAFG